MSEREHIEKRVSEVIANLLHELHGSRRTVPVTRNASLQRDLGIDSLALAELHTRLERDLALRLPDGAATGAETVHDLVEAVMAAGVDLQPSPGPEPVQKPDDEAAVTPVPGEAATLDAVLDWHVKHQGNRVHLRLSDGQSESEELTYSALAAEARDFAHGLRSWGLQPGERVAIMLPTCREFFISFLGVILAGGISVPMYPPARPSQIEEHLRRQAGILRNAGASLLLVPQQGKTITGLLATQVKSLRAALAPGDDALKPRERAPLPPAPKAQDLAFLQYTSGSTGDPKGVMLTHANLIANIRAMGEAIDASHNDVFVSWLPLYHDLGLIGAWLGSLYYAVPVAVMSPLNFLLRPASWLWMIHRHKATLSAAPNFAFELCLNRIHEADIEGLDLSSLRLIANGAESVNPDTIRRFTERFEPYGFRPEAMAPVYGLAESTVGLAFPPLGRYPIIERIDRAALMNHGRAEPAPEVDNSAIQVVACGMALPGHEVRIVDEAGRELGDRREGRLQFRGPSSTQGYYQNSEKTRELFDSGWVETGDLAYMAGGDIFLTGRVKDVIIKAGRQIYPSEIEAAIGDIEGIRKGCVAAFAAADNRLGTERLVVIAETRERDGKIRSELKGKISSAVVDILGAAADDVVLVGPHGVPKTSSGKIRRSAARKLYEEGELGRPSRPLWWQLARLAVSGLPMQLRKAMRLAGDTVYAGWWWFVIGLLGAVGLLSVFLLPRRKWRWRVMRALARMAFSLTGIPVRVRGLELLPSPPAILVVNHASYIDSLALAAVLPDEPVFIAKAELQTHSVAGPFLSRLGVAFAERINKSAGEAEVEKIAELLQAHQRLVFFPEGTFLRMSGLLSFRLGAFLVAVRTGATVAPVVLKGTRSVLRGTQWFPRWGKIDIEVLKPLDGVRGGFETAIDLRDRARDAILGCCGEPDLSHERVIITREGVEHAS